MKTAWSPFPEIALPDSVKKFVTPVIAATLLLCSGPWLRATPVQWTVASGGNGHYYDRISAPSTVYSAAVTAAANSTYLGLQGHLVTFDITTTAAYTAERDFVYDNVFRPGLTTNSGFWIGASLPTGGTSSDWTWVDGTSVPASIVNAYWLVDHNEGAGPEGATFYDIGDRRVYDYITTNSTGLIAGYLVEYQAVPEPATVALLAAGGLLALGVCRKRS